MFSPGEMFRVTEKLKAMKELMCRSMLETTNIFMSPFWDCFVYNY